MEGINHGVTGMLSRNFLGEDEKNDGNLSQDSLWPSRGSNRAHPECGSFSLPMSPLADYF
jgi:hypothetical protein